MIGPITPEHHARILQLNHDFVHWLSPLDADALTELIARCGYARQIGGGGAFLLGYDGNSAYRHKNVEWLSARLPAYSYVDRVVVGPDGQGKGWGRALYEDFALWSRAQGREVLGCEVNTRPDNPASRAFHQRLGFEPLGDEVYGEVALRYYAKRLV